MGKFLVWDLEGAIETVQMGKFSRVDGSKSFILSIQWSYLDEEEVHTKAIYETKSFKKAFYNDKDLCKFAYDLLSDPEVDGWITQNGTGFDVPLLNTRLLIHGLPVLPLKDHADTLKMARKGAGRILLGSYSLDNMTKVFGLPPKGKVDFRIWNMAKAGNVKAIKEIVDYGADDIPATKALYNMLSRTHARGLTQRFNGLVCVRCGSDKLKKNGTRVLARSSEQQIVCKSCGKWHSLKV